MRRSGRQGTKGQKKNEEAKGDEEEIEGLERKQ